MDEKKFSIEQLKQELNDLKYFLTTGLRKKERKFIEEFKETCKEEQKVSQEICRYVPGLEMGMDKVEALNLILNELKKHSKAKN